MNKLQYSAIYVGDLHGKIWAFEEAVKKFEDENLEKLVLLGDYVDSYDCTDVEIVHLLNQIIDYKKANKKKVVCLLGNHDMQYIHPPDYGCSGKRNTIKDELYDLFSKNHDLFQIAFRNGDFFSTHAGILSSWLEKYNDRLHYYADKLHIDRVDDLDILLNAINETSDRWILNTVPMIRGGLRGSIGGPIWADITEIKSGTGCLYKYTQIVGHNKVPTIEKYQHKGGPTIIFTDCLDSSTEYLTLKKE